MASITRKLLDDAKKNKHDEYYTFYSSIENELKYYKYHFKNKVVLCNCNDNTSQFFQYFVNNFNELKLKKLISVSYKENAQYIVMDGAGTKTFDLGSNGDFRSPESLALLEQCDIVVTNPPFSLFRDLIEQILKYGKKFLVMGSNNAISYKETFNLIMDNKMWLGTVSNKSLYFYVPEEYKNLKQHVKTDENGKHFIHVGGISWFTNLEHEKRNEGLLNSLNKKYDPDIYPKYDNYHAIEVGALSDIPDNFADPMGVPITYLGSHNPTEFEIIGSNRSLGYNALYVNGEEKYRRIIIRNLCPLKPSCTLPVVDENKKIFDTFFEEG